MRFDFKTSHPLLEKLNLAKQGVQRAELLKGIDSRNVLHILTRTAKMGRSIATLAMFAAERFPNVPAMIDDKGAISFKVLDQRVIAIASSLKYNYQLKEDDTVAILCRNHREFLEGFLAAMRLGLNVVLLNTEFPGPQLQQVLQRHDLALLVHDQECSENVSKAEFQGKTILAWCEQPQVNTVTLDQLAQGQPKALHRIRRSGKIILLTSGTTGVPKGAPRASNPIAFIGPVLTLFAKIPFAAEYPVFIAPPLFHGFGLAFMAVCLLIGSPMVVQRRFSPSDIHTAIQQHQVKILVAVPMMLQRILNINEQHKKDLSSLCVVLAAAAPLSATLATQWMDKYGDHLYNLYGSSETGFCSMASPADLRAAPGTVGLAPLGTQIKIFNEDGKVSADNQVGRICIKSRMVFEGYVGGGNKQRFDGYMTTGDVGHINSQGYLFVDGRDDDMIFSGGENVFPQEIEELLAQHADVLDVAVIGVSDEEFGQRLCAFVVLKDTKTPNEDELRIFIRSHVARY